MNNIKVIGSVLLLLISFNLKANVLDHKYEQIYTAMYNNDNEKAVMLLSRIKDVNYIIDERAGRTLLTEAAGLNNLYLVKYLISHHADVNLSDADGFTPIIISAEKDNLDMFKYFLNNKADICATDRLNNSIIYYSKSKKIDSYVRIQYKKANCKVNE